MCPTPFLSILRTYGHSLAIDISTHHLSPPQSPAAPLTESLFFKDMTNLNTQKRMKVWDKKFNELLGLPQVIVTPHIAFLTTTALDAIASTTRENLAAGAQGRELVNEVKFKG